MIFHTKIPKNSNTQAGVSLMLAVLVLSALTAITFSLVTIVMVEIRASGDVLRTEPALYATLGLTEEAMFQYKRFVNEREDGTVTETMNIVNLCKGTTPDNNNVCTIGGVTLTTPDIGGDEQPLDFDESPKVVTVLAGTSVELPLYAKDDYNILYDSIEIDMIPNGTTGGLNVFLEQNPSDDSTPADIIADSNYQESESALELTTFMAPTVPTQFDLVLENNTTSNFLVVITSEAGSLASGYGYSDGDSMGLPFVGEKALKVIADYLGLTRTYTAIIPVP